MEVRLAKTAGFCMGVKLAHDKVLSLTRQGRGAVYTYGPLIHNRQAIEGLEAKGIRNIEECPEVADGTVVIRAHGVPLAVIADLEARGFGVVDATCPHVMASQRHIERRAAQGYTIVIAGDKDHAEVEGLKSRAGPRCLVVSTLDEARAAEVAAPACLVAQTTFGERLYTEIAAALRERCPAIEVVQSICRSTRRRQEEALRLAGEVEAMVVVGARHSANTCRLAELCRQEGKPTFHVETADELDPQALSGFRVVGLTAGASTPNWVTRSVLQALEDIGASGPGDGGPLWRLATLLTRSNAYSALATVALTYASCQLMGIAAPSPIFLLSAFCYVFAVTTLNRLSPGDGPELVPPPRVAFYRRHAGPLLAASVLIALGSFAALAISRAWVPLMLLLVAYGLGVAYSVRLVPRQLLPLARIARLKDVPASKDIFIAVGWLVVCVLVPWVGHGAGALPAFATACVFALGLTFVKANVVDLRDMQEDRLLGRETLPILLGAKRTRRVMSGLTLGVAAALALAAALGWTPSVAWPLLAAPGCLLGYLAWRERFEHASDVVCTLAADGALLLAGILALAWRLLS